MAVLNLQVNHTLNDAMQYGTGLPGVTNEGTLIMNSDEDINGHRFPSVTIPQGATISAASLKLYIHNTTYDTVACTASCEDADDTSAFGTGNDDLYNRPLTTANSAVSVTDVGAAGADHYEIVDIASAVQEVVNRPGWTSGNSLVVLLHGWTSGDLRCRTYDNDPTRGAKLDITYTTASGVPKQAMYYAMMRES